MSEGREQTEDVENLTPETGVVGSVAQEYERAAAVHRPQGYVLTLFVAGAAPRSLRAVAHVRRLCQEYLSDCHQLEVIDIYQEPAIAEREGILAVPALIKYYPPPSRLFIGDMSNTDRVLEGLGLSRKAGGGERK